MKYIFTTIFLSVIACSAVNAQEEITPYVTLRSGEKIYYEEVTENLNKKGCKAQNENGKESYRLKEVNSFVCNYRTNKFDSIPLTQKLIFGGDPDYKHDIYDNNDKQRSHTRILMGEGNASFEVYYVSGDTLFGLAWMSGTASLGNSDRKVTASGNVGMTYGSQSGAIEGPVTVLIIGNKLWTLALRHKVDKPNSDAQFLKDNISDPYVLENINRLVKAKATDFKTNIQCMANIRMHYMANLYREL